jgi:peroxiredoxin
VFYRSADWCPYCKTELIDLQSRVNELKAQGYGLAAISYDGVPVLADFSIRRGITFPLLSDAGSATIKAYGILNPVPEEALGPGKDDPAVAAEVQKFVSVVRPTAAMVGIAFPGTFMLDRQGRVTSRFFEPSYIERNTVASILTKVSGLHAPVAATKISTAHLEMMAYGSDATIAAGNHFSLSVTITPHAGVHVYAPGAADYRIISLKLDLQPFLKILPVKYPASETYFFKPLNERVPTYQKPFTLVQDIVLDGALQSQAAYRGKESLTITGTLEYQACDDKVCFTPTAVPVSWTVALRPLDTQRAARP